MCLALLVALPKSPLATTWEAAIAAVESRATEYSKRADALGYPISVGTALNELHVPIHQCAILGRMLGKAELIVDLEPEYPAISRTGYEFRVAAISLNNWAFTARRLLKLDEPRRVRTWNLDCAGQHGIPSSAAIPQEDGAAFFDVIDGQGIRILGDVTTGFAQRLIDAVQALPAVQFVALGSGGGSVVEALLAGRYIRSRNLATTLWNNCYSACSLVFLGGNKRTIWSPYPKLGFHMVSVRGDAVPANHAIYGEIAMYSQQMGADPATVVGAMLRAPPTSMHYLDHDQMCRAKIVTWIQRSCF
jgi:hypothetical protein